MLTVYGIKNCDTVRKALKALDAAQHDVTFVDVRKDGLSQATVESWLEHVDVEVLLNKRGTSWRNLSDAEKLSAQADPAAAIVQAPTLFKRPVIVAADGAISVGWKKPEQDLYLG